MSVNPLKHALVPVCMGAIKSNGRQLIKGEIVEAFWTWPELVKKLHLDQHKVIWMSAEDASISNAKAEEIREAGRTKQKVAKTKGTEAQFRGVVELIREMDKQREELAKRAYELEDQLRQDGIDTEALLSDEGRRPEDSSSDASNRPEMTEVEEATGIKPTPAPEPKEPELVGEPEENLEKMEALDEITVAKFKDWASKLTYRDLEAQAKAFGIGGRKRKAAELVEMVLGEAIKAEQQRRASAGE